MITMVTTPEELAASELAIEGERHQHLFRARRVEPGARLRLVDGRGNARWAHVAAVDRKRALLVPAEAASPNEPASEVRLLVPLPRPERAAWLVEKATEIGVAAIHFLHSERAPRSIGEGTLARLVRVAVAAVEQCHRARIPEITGVHGWEELPVLIPSTASRWLLDPQAPPPAPLGIDRAAQAVLLVGPEGGFTAGELERTRALDFTALGLGPTILRIETAALVGAARLLMP